MGLLSLRRAESRAIDASKFGVNTPDWLPVSAAGVQVNEDAALSVPSFAACMARKQDAMMAMPIDAYVVDGDSRRPVDGPAWLRRPNVEQTWRPWIGEVSWSLELDSNAYVAVFRDRAGRASQLLALDHRVVTPYRRRGRKGFEVDGVDYGGEVLHIVRSPRDGQVAGRSLVSQNAELFGLAVAVQRYAAQFFGQGGVPPFVFEMTSDQPNPEALKEVGRWWRQSRQRAGAHTPGFIWGGRPVPLGFDAQKSQLTEAQSALGVQIAALCGVPPVFVGLGATGSSLTYANVVDSFVDFIRKAMLPTMELVAEALSDDQAMLMPKSTRVRFRTEIFEKADTASRYAAYKVGIEAGFLTVEDVRALEDMEPLASTAERAQRDLSLVEAVQKVYLGVGKVITADEGRQMLNDMGAQLDVPGPIPPEGGAQ